MSSRIPIAVLFLVIILATGSVHAATAVKVGPNVDIIPGSDRQQSETTVAVDPRNPNIVVAGAQDYNLQSGCCPPAGHRWHGYYRSTDGGITWSVSLLPGFPGDTSPQGLASPLSKFELTSDPVLAFDGNGNVYYVGIAVNFNAAGNFVSVSGFVAKYVNDGASYAGVVLVSSASDKPWIAVDTSGGPNDGNIYLVYIGVFRNLSGSFFARSTDGGSSFSDPILVPSNTFVTGVAVDSTGTVYTVSEDFSGNILVSKSTDGGLSLSSATIAASGLQPIPQVFLPGNHFRVVTLPQIAADNKGVYIVTDDNSTGNPDVLFIRSLDAGASWSSPIRVNDVEINAQFDPAIAVSGGTISIVWYDSRLGQLSNGTITALDVFYARSTNAGTSFSKNLRVTSMSFNPNSVTTIDFARHGPFIGDYIQIAAAPTSAHPVWTDNRNACDFIDPTLGCLDQDAFSATITY